MSTLRAHHLLTLSNSAVPQNVAFTTYIPAPVFKDDHWVRHQYVFDCNCSAKPCCYILNDGEVMGGTGPYDDDGD